MLDRRTGSFAPLLAVCGTRPEAVKLAPVVHALRDRGHQVVLVATGQHPDLAPAMLREAGLTADIDLGVNQPGATPAQLLAAILTYLSPVYAAYRPQLALVQGDTVSTLAGALAAAYARVPVGHVEAGLRTGDRAEPFPEELQRQMVTPLATLHFAPTQHAASALRREGVDPSRVFVTGNSGIDALDTTLQRLDSDPGLRATLAARFPFVAQSRCPLLLVTVHRRENLGPRMQSIAAALARLAGFFDVEIVVPLHPNPEVQGLLRERLGGLEGVHLTPAVDHATMAWLMRSARLLLTDSGGLQEEAPSLGLRTLVLRTTTERVEGLIAGAAELVELQADSIVAAVRRTLARPPMVPVHPFGDGRASARIADIVDSWLGRGAHERANLSLTM
jgi:UDP-N-acetylglucosamine 2-epimerase (non-hydrolysing)